MRFTAEDVLADCRLAHEVMEAESDHNLLRLQWIGALALLRLVGDVLDKVDAKRGEQVKSSISLQFEQDRNDEMYRDFIKGSRDRAIHTYDHDLLDASEIPVLLEYSDGELEQYELDECLFMPLTKGFRAGEDARDVYSAAISWWATHIESIKERIA
ncbi:hypothetical protein [Altererythrobacter sp. MTPC7]|uniref:hypothetical protein n=1 Tax=Altererythrobacter sp. MTPC7 TaxID=3056567 RepID=UPI0036F33C94